MRFASGIKISRDGFRAWRARSSNRPIAKFILSINTPQTIPIHTIPKTMSIQDNANQSYVPVQSSTPTQTPQSTPISTPTRARIIRSNFLSRGSPIKFDLSTPEKATLKDVDFDWGDEKGRKQGAVIRKVVFQILLGISWAVLAAVAIYLYPFLPDSLLTYLGRSSISQLPPWV